MALRLTQILRFAAKPSSGPKSSKTPDQSGRWKVSGLTAKDLKKHYAIIPIYIISILGMGLAGGYVLRLATQHPEVSWTKSNSEPWNDYKNRQYKFVGSGRDYSKGTPTPPYK